MSFHELINIIIKERIKEEGQRLDYWMLKCYKSEVSYNIGYFFGGFKVFVNDQDSIRDVLLQLTGHKFTVFKGWEIREEINRPWLFRTKRARVWIKILKESEQK